MPESRPVFQPPLMAARRFRGCAQMQKAVLESCKALKLWFAVVEDVEVRPTATDRFAVRIMKRPPTDE